MTTTSEMFEFAQLSAAAYASLPKISTTTNAQAANFLARGFVSTQVEVLAAKFPNIVTQFNDQAGTSFSSTVFKDAPENLTVPIRGSAEIFGDLLPTDF